MEENVDQSKMLEGKGGGLGPGPIKIISSIPEVSLGFLLITVAINTFGIKIPKFITIMITQKLTSPSSWTIIGCH